MVPSGSTSSRLSPESRTQRPSPAPQAFGACPTRFGISASEGIKSTEKDGLVAFVERDELDIPSIMVWRIPVEVC